MKLNSFVRGRSGLTCVLVILFLLATACTPAAVEEPAEPEPAREEPIEPAPAMEEPTEAEPAPEEPMEPVSLEFWYSGTLQDQEFVENQVAEFQAQNPDIEVVLYLEPFEFFFEKLTAHLAAGVPPDIVTLSLNEIVSLYDYGGYLVSLEEIGEFEWEDFVDDASMSVSIAGSQMGLPLRQYACAPVYQYLSVFEQTLNYPDQTLRLLNFLTTSELQIRANEAAGWSPTRLSALEALGFECPFVEAIRLEPAQVLNTISLVERRASTIENVLGGFALNPYESTAVIEDGELQGTGAALMQTVDLNFALEKLAGEGLVFGGLFVDQAPEYPPGDYALICWEDGTCRLVASDGTTVELVPDVFEETDIPVEKPIVVVEAGSKKKCYRVLFWKVCARVG